MRIVLTILVAAFGLSAVAIDCFVSQRNPHRSSQLARWGLALWAVLSIVILMLLFANHLTFPLNLEALESTLLQHLNQLMRGKPVYPEPTSDYIPLAYNVGYYLLSVPFAWVLGASLTTLRLVAILGSVGIGILLYLIVRQKTDSRWWGLMAVGLYAAAYSVMESYLDNAHSDSWFVFMALLGSYVIDRRRGTVWNLVGLLMLIASFWFKQHGAFFVIGGVLYLTWQDGFRHSMSYWFTALILGPVLYFGLGPALFGERYIYFTWEVPRGWSELDLSTVYRFSSFIIVNYFFLALIAGLHFIEKFWLTVTKKDRTELSIWHFQLVFALVTGMLGSLDVGSLDNVYIPMGIFFILVGTLGLYNFTDHSGSLKRFRVHLTVLVLAFAFLVYNPFRFMVSPAAAQQYDEFVEFLNGLDGPVYAPWVGQLQSEFVLSPAAHWVALDDMIRGPGNAVSNHPNTRYLLSDLISPSGSAYVLTNLPLQADPLLDFLLEYYVLETDLGERFMGLSTLPKRFMIEYPRYLYRYNSENRPDS